MAITGKSKKIVVGMSGGVDSSVALILLKRAGFSPVGVSLKYAVWEDSKNKCKENVCCNADSFRIAESVCKKLGVPYHIFDVSQDFKKEVIDYFTNELKAGRTPNPCVICNLYLKFKKLFDWAAKRKIKYVATGHYARSRKNPKTGLYELLKARDKEKDQTYTLSAIPQKLLSRIIFPLGDLLKKEVYGLAKNEGFEIFSKIKQSQDFCFVSGKSMEHFLKKEIGAREGKIKDAASGNILGKHKGLHFYTIGQRKGINLPDGPYFVSAMNKATNTLFVTKEEKELMKKSAILEPCSFISGKWPLQSMKIMAKIRYRHEAAAAMLNPISSTACEIVFDAPQKAVTPGQFAVFYQKNACLGCGMIIGY